MRRRNRDVHGRMAVAREVTVAHDIMERMLSHVDGADREEAVRSRVLANIDELDVLRSEVELKHVGGRHPLLDPRHTTSGGDRREARRLDRELVRRLHVIQEASRRIERALAEGALEEPEEELAAVLSEILSIRNHYSMRNHVMKGVRR